MWAFNHDESSRSFAKAARLDPQCAICLWGVALTVGPNYNMPMMAESRAKVAFDSLERAAGLLSNASPVEQALVKALKARYPRPQALDPTNLDPVLRAYANEMHSVAAQFPDDSDIQTMYAESLSGGYLFAQAAALAAKGRIPEARKALADLDTLRAAVPADAPAGLNVAPDVLALASKIG